MKTTKIITHEGHLYKVTMDITKLNETANGFYMNFKVNGKMLKVPVNNDTDGTLSDKEVQAMVSKAAPIALAAIKAKIEELWYEWMDGEYSDVLCNDMIQDLFDLVNVIRFSNGEIYIEFMLNSNYASHKYSRVFFGCHTMTAGGYFKNGKYEFRYATLEG